MLNKVNGQIMQRSQLLVFPCGTKRLHADLIDKLGENLHTNEKIWICD